jgi:phosphoribosylamine--glycine ligase
MKGCENLPLAVEDFAGMTAAVKAKGVSLVVVGPELPLSLGITDYLKKEGIAVFGPDQMGAQIESSKSWAKDIMLAAGVPTAISQTFTEAAAAKEYVAQQGSPIVVKADGLAAGKGVVVASTVAEAQEAIDFLFQENYTKLVIEEYLEGEEVSVLALSDGVTIRPLLPAQDHKRIGEGDTGNNTGGMGTYAPAPLASPEIMAKVDREVLQPTLAELRKRDIDYRGILYAGLMVSPKGEVKVLEFNCRFGDPETQVVLPLLETPLDQLLLACVEQRLAELPPLAWKRGCAVCVVAASAGYPGSYDKGKVITGFEAAEAQGTMVFHAGTKSQNNQIITDGGRVLGITALAEDFEKAIATAYQGIDCIQFEGIYYRRDIAHRVRNRH